MDNVIGVFGILLGIGFDLVLGLIFGGGDVLGGLIFIYIVFFVLIMGLFKNILIKMVINIVFDFLVGIVFIFGDLFDVVWKVNFKNMDLLESYLVFFLVYKKVDNWFIFIFLGCLILFVIVMGILGVFIISLLVKIIEFIILG